MAETIACLVQGKVSLLDGSGRPLGLLQSPHQAPAEAHAPGHHAAPIVGLTRGRARGEVYYAIRVPNGTALFAQTPGSAEEQRLFLGVDAQISELDYSFGDEALTFTVPGPRGTSAIGSLADDGKGLRTVTEGDVVDCTPRWALGGRGEILYASAGVGRTRAGAWVGLGPFALHRLRFADNSVEVLMADAKYDYSAPIPSSGTHLYALRRPYRAPTPPSALAAVFGLFRARVEGREPELARVPEARELVRITPRGVDVVADGVLSFDVSASGDLVYATVSHVFRSTANAPTQAEPIARVEQVEHLVVC